MLQSICVFGAGTRTNIHMMEVVAEEAEEAEEAEGQQETQQREKEAYLSWTFWIMGSEHWPSTRTGTRVRNRCMTGRDSRRILSMRQGS